MAEFGPKSIDFKLEMADFKLERADFKLERTDFRAERANFRFESSTGGTNGRTDGRTDEIKSPCVLQDFVPFAATAQKELVIQGLYMVSGT